MAAAAVDDAAVFATADATRTGSGSGATRRREARLQAHGEELARRVRGGLRRAWHARRRERELPHESMVREDPCKVDPVLQRRNARSNSGTLFGIHEREQTFVRRRVGVERGRFDLS